MTKEDKQLLLIDLCARLPYGVMVSVQGGEFDSYKYPYQLIAISKFGLDSFCKIYHPIYTPFGVPNIENIKPYLRPMSSMTEEEREEESYIWNEHETNLIREMLNFYCSHHLDWNSLIRKGLALEAPDGMYKFKNMNWNFYPEERFSSYDEFITYLKEKKLALEAPEEMYKTE